MKLRKHTILPRFTNELLKLQEIKRVARLPSRGIVEPALLQNSLFGLLLLGGVLSVVHPPFCVFAQPGTAAAALLPLVSLGALETPPALVTMGILQTATHLGIPCSQSSAVGQRKLH